MSLSDPFESTYRGSQQAGASLGLVGQGLEQGAGAIEQVAQQKQQQKLQLLGGMMGHMLDKGLIKPNDSFIKTMGKYFGGLGFDVSKPQTVTDILGNIPTEKYTKKIKVGTQGQVEGIELEEKSPEEEARKQAELELKKGEAQRKQQEIKQAEIKASTDIPFFDALTNSPRAKRANQIKDAIQKQTIQKLSYEKYRGQLKEGEALVRRGNKIMAIPKGKEQDTDEVL